jgi:transcriptional regulator with XRE-family HTH domain
MYTKANGSIAQQLYEISKASNKTQRQQAMDMKYLPLELSYLFHGRRIMKIADAERIADYLGYELKLVRKGG